MANTYSAGIVTAYGAAKKAGYTGTYEQFCADQANFARYAQQVREDKESVEQTVETFSETTVPTAVQSVTDEGTRQIGLVGNAGTAQIGNINDAGTTQVGVVNQAGTTQVGNVNQAGTNQVNAVNQAGATQVQAVEDKGEEVINSIPSDYSDLTAEVDDLSRQLSDETTGLDTKAPVILETVSGSIASFDDGADSMPVKSLVAQIEPVQDLHGYDNPWPAGGGDNICPVMTGVSNNGLTATVDSDGVITVSGTATGTGVFITDTVTLPKTITAGTTVTFGTTTSLPGRIRLFLSPNGSADIDENTNSNTFSKDVDFNGLRLYLFTTAGAVYNFKIYPKLVVGSSAGSWTPYSNICPISGWDGLEGKRAGKNLLDPNIVRSKGYNRFFENPLTKPGTYMMSTQNQLIVNGVALGAALFFNDESLNRIGDVVIGYVFGKTLMSQAFTPTEEQLKAKYISLNFNGEGATQSTIDDAELQLELGSKATDYEPYQGNQISVTFPSSAGTVYGGTLTLNPDRTGALVVEDAAVDIGTLSWGKRATEDPSVRAYRTEISGRKFGTNSEGIKGQCSQYSFRGNSTLDSLTNNMQNGYFGFQASNGGVVVRDDRYATAQDFTEAVSGVLLVYPLAEPITYTLTASEIDGILTTLYGDNNIWADTGDVTVEYPADTKLFIEKLTQPTEDDMTADHAISAGTFFTIGNNLYLATSQIAAGGTITPGTNATQLSLADALNQLNT